MVTLWCMSLGKWQQYLGPPSACGCVPVVYLWLTSDSFTDWRLMSRTLFQVNAIIIILVVTCLKMGWFVLKWSVLSRCLISLQNTFICWASTLYLDTNAKNCLVVDPSVNALACFGVSVWQFCGEVTALYAGRAQKAHRTPLSHIYYKKVHTHN